MEYKKVGNAYVIRLDRGEEIVSGILEFCRKNKIKLGYFSGIGAVDKAELAHYSVESKKYSNKAIEEPLEITNLAGNITTMNGEVYLHCHITLSDVNMDAIGGHLKEGIVGATCEIVLVELDGVIDRKYDDAIGLNLMNL